MAKKAVSKAKEQIWGTGRRKKAIARVRIMPGEGNIVVNKQSVEEYFKLDTLITIVKQPLVLVGAEKKYDVMVNVYGGGLTGQAGAVRHGIARALVLSNEAYKADIKAAGFLTRDPRMKERKKYGLKKARKAPQFSKR
ncbi:MAG: 30S ribosomal protein S9 [Clostridia bacterium]|nr:30S ribosomal protein S9 [Clostridia bacterium]